MIVFAGFVGDEVRFPANWALRHDVIPCCSGAAEESQCVRKSKAEVDGGIRSKRGSTRSSVVGTHR